MSSIPSYPIRDKKTIIREFSCTRMMTIILTLVFLGLFVQVGRTRYGSISNALQYLRGERLLVDDRVRLVGDVKVGDQIRIPYTFTNWSDRNIKLLWAKTSCSCLVVDDLPTTITPGESRAISVGLDVPREASEIYQKVTIYSTDKSRGELTLEIFGRASTNTRPP